MLSRNVVLAPLLPAAVLAGGREHKIRVMFTNDDGYRVWPLQEAFRYFAESLSSRYESFVSAPKKNGSGRGRHQSLSESQWPAKTGTTEVDQAYAHSDRVWWTDADPVDAAAAGLSYVNRKIFGGGGGGGEDGGSGSGREVDLVISGTNSAQNTGAFTVASGTANNAAYAASLGVPAVAFSGGWIGAVKKNFPFYDEDPRNHQDQRGGGGLGGSLLGKRRFLLDADPKAYSEYYREQIVRVVEALREAADGKDDENDDKKSSESNNGGGARLLPMTKDPETGRDVSVWLNWQFPTIHPDLCEESSILSSVQRHHQHPVVLVASNPRSAPFRTWKSGSPPTPEADQTRLGYLSEAMNDAIVPLFYSTQYQEYDASRTAADAASYARCDPRAGLPLEQVVMTDLRMARGCYSVVSVNAGFPEDNFAAGRANTAPAAAVEDVKRRLAKVLTGCDGPVEAAVKAAVVGEAKE